MYKVSVSLQETDDILQRYLKISNGKLFEYKFSCTLFKRTFFITQINFTLYTYCCLSECYKICPFLARKRIKEIS